MDENIKLFQMHSGWSEDECEKFIGYIYRYLHSCGYFMDDYNIHGIERKEDYVPYSRKGIGKWLLDMALQFNMEIGNEYEVKKL